MTPGVRAGAGPVDRRPAGFGNRLRQVVLIREKNREPGRACACRISQRGHQSGRRGVTLINVIVRALNRGPLPREPRETVEGVVFCVAAGTRDGLQAADIFVTGRVVAGLAPCESRRAFPFDACQAPRQLVERELRGPAPRRRLRVANLRGFAEGIDFVRPVARVRIRCAGHVTALVHGPARDVAIGIRVAHDIAGTVVFHPA